MLCLAVGVQCQPTLPPESMAGVNQVEIEVSAANLASEDEVTRFAREDPLGFLKHCREQVVRRIDGYRCTFIKQELVNGKLTAEQWMDVRHRCDPYSVDMTWTRNPGLVSRALFVEGRWMKDGKERAWVRPSGLAKWLKLQQDIHSDMADDQSRRSIDQFGFRRSLDLIIKYSEKAKAEGKLDLRYVGQGRVEGRPVFAFERVLPYTGQEEPYPDRLLQVYFDQEWLTPICCISYADDDGTELLGKYVYKDVEYNPGYSDGDFDPDQIDF